MLAFKYQDFGGIKKGSALSPEPIETYVARLLEVLTLPQNKQVNYTRPPYATVKQYRSYTHATKRSDWLNSESPVNN